MRIGVLALQGDFAKHIAVLQRLGVDTQEVRKPEDLAVCDGLIIPGGESTSMIRQLDFIGLREPLLAFAKEKPLFGTCAGLILMAKQVENSSMATLGLLDIAVARNAYGRQVESFQSEVPLEIKNEKAFFPAIFIRAPRIIEVADNVEVFAKLGEEPILIRQGHYLGATFHPELTTDLQIHKYFIDMIKKVS
jgi:pyridoxal 5'-phosphate synthase pdxT subunit